MSTVTIKKLIAHDLNLNGQRPILSDRLIDLNNGVVVRFFADHISASLKAKQTKSCKFRYEKSSVLLHSTKISKDIENNETIIKCTKDMTHFLFSNMKGTASNGTVIYIVYLDNSNGLHYLAILKMDPNKGIQIDRQTFTLKVQEDMLPSANEKLHKCAFVKLDPNLWNEEIHLKVLDKQQVTGEIAKYFLNGFLEAEPYLDDKAMTKLVEETLKDFAISEKLITGTKEIIDFTKKVDKILCNGNEVDLDRDLDSLFKTYLPGEADRLEKIDKYKESLIGKKENVYFEFTSDKKQTIVELIDKDNLISVRYPVQHATTKVSFETYEEEDGQISTLIKFIGVELKEKFKFK